jgi:hypothetical protein
MPYIADSCREILLPLPEPATVGQLNYVVSKITHGYIEYYGLNYDTINAVIGVLECAKLELYRMVAAPYENQKQAENGPISGLDEHT